MTQESFVSSLPGTSDPGHGKLPDAGLRSQVDELTSFSVAPAKAARIWSEGSAVLQEKVTCEPPLKTGSGYMGSFETVNRIDGDHHAVASFDRHPCVNQARNQRNISHTYLCHSEDLGGPMDLVKSLGHGREAVSLTSAGHEDMSVKLNDIGNGDLAQRNYLNTLQDIDRAIEYWIHAAISVSGVRTNQQCVLASLAKAYQARFTYLENRMDLDKSIQYYTEAAELAPWSDSDKLTILSDLGNSYLARFQCFGGLLDLSKSIECGEQAVALTPEDHKYRSKRLNSLGTSYLARFKHLYELRDLNASIRCGVEATSLAPSGDPDRSERLSSLGESYLTRFERLGDLSDLNKSIGCGTEAVSNTPDGHTGRCKRLSDLGNSYLARFKCLGEVTDLQKSIDYGVEAASLAPNGDPDRPGRLSNLSESYLTCFERLGDLSDLNKSIGCGAEAVSITPNGHMDRPRRLGNLGNSYLARFSLLGEISDLDTSIEHYEQVVFLIPDGVASKPGWLARLGRAYHTRFVRLGEAEDLESAVIYYKMAGQLPTGSPMFRFQACREWARLSSHCAAFSPYLAYQQAMNLLPQLVWIGTSVDRRYSIITEVGDLATEAASHAIAIGSYGRALEWLEAGRSIVWGQIAQLRTPVDELAIQRPELADRIREVGRRLEHTTSESSESSMHGAKLESDSSRHHELAVEWERLLGEARSVPGFEHFLSPPTLSQLLGIVQSHPIVVINIHESRCDALILHPNNKVISHVPLTEFEMKSGITACEHLVATVGRERGGGFKRAGKSGSLTQSLKYIWFAIVKPILDFLGYTRPLSINQLPRITWCTTGLLSFLPLHAAGCYDDTGPHAFNFVISSYTPTLSALLKPQSANPESYCGILAVGQTNTPGFNKLTHTSDELAVIKQHTQVGDYLQLEDACATVDRVLEAMDRYSWVHMACHGTQNPSDPRQSAFYLHGDKLTLATIASRSFRNKGLAFLSACQTARGDQTMPEEAVHLAAGMLMAGFPSVIGTMWGIADEDGPQVADRVYAELLSDGKPNHVEAARALHKATAELREKVGVGLIARWAPFIHIGV